MEGSCELDIGFCMAVTTIPCVVFKIYKIYLCCYILKESFQLEIPHVFHIFHFQFYLSLAFKFVSFTEFSCLFFSVLRRRYKFKPIDNAASNLYVAYMYICRMYMYEMHWEKYCYFAFDLHLLNCLTRPIRALRKSIM